MSTAILLLPYVINSPGQYHFVSNLTQTVDGPNIIINASDVIVNQNGFTLFTNASFPITNSVGYQLNSVNNVKIENGTIENLTASTTSLNIGINILNSSDIRLQKLRLIDLFRGLGINNSSNISLNNMVFDLKNNGAVRGISVAVGVNGLSIEKTIVLQIGPGSPNSSVGPLGNFLLLLPGSNNFNILLHKVEFVNRTVARLIQGASAAGISAITNGLLIKKCHGVNCGNILLRGFTNVKIICSKFISGATNPFNLIQIGGLTQGSIARNVLIKKCHLESPPLDPAFTDQGFTLVEVDNAENVVISNSKLISNNPNAVELIPGFVYFPPIVQLGFTDFAGGGFAVRDIKIVDSCFRGNAFSAIQSQPGQSITSNSDIEIRNVNIDRMILAGVIFSNTINSSIIKNKIVRSNIGILIDQRSSNNRIICNLIKENEIGILLDETTFNNRVFNNCLINNVVPILNSGNNIIGFNKIKPKLANGLSILNVMVENKTSSSSLPNHRFSNKIKIDNLPIVSRSEPEVEE